VGPEALAVHLGAGLRQGGPGAGRSSTELLAVGLVTGWVTGFDAGFDAGEQHLRPAHIRERAASGDPCLHRLALGSGPGQPGHQVVVRPVGDVRGEREREVPLVRNGPSERRRLPTWCEKLLEVLDHLLGRDHGHEHPHAPSVSGP
jgi:hypothetical protein